MTEEQKSIGGKLHVLVTCPRCKASIWVSKEKTKHSERRRSKYLCALCYDDVTNFQAQSNVKFMGGG